MPWKLKEYIKKDYYYDSSAFVKVEWKNSLLYYQTIRILKDHTFVLDKHSWDLEIRNKETLQTCHFSRKARLRHRQKYRKISLALLWPTSFRRSFEDNQAGMLLVNSVETLCIMEWKIYEWRQRPVQIY